MSNVLSLRLPAETKQRLDELSLRTRRPASVHVREALDKYLDNLEDYYLAAEALEEHRKDPTTYSLEEVGKELGLDS